MYRSTLGQAIAFLSLLFLFPTAAFTQFKSQEFNLSFDKKAKNSQKELLSKKFKIEITQELSFVGISAFVMDTNIAANFSVRVKNQSGWTDWQTLKKNTHDITPDRTVYEGQPFFDKFTSIQFKSSDLLQIPVRFRLFIREKKASNTVQSVKTFTDCTCPIPEICDRDCWCPTCPIDPTPEPTTPTHIVIHHSAGFNESDDYAGVVAYYYDLHVNTNGWDDIGYNFLIDPNGVIYEGRGNGLQGAHFSCMNTNTVGVCVIGNFMTVAPQPSAIQHLLDFIAWEACLYDIDVDDYSYLPVADMDLNNVCGHRDGNESESPNSCASGTECPGDVLYGLIPTFRDLVSYFSCLQDITSVEEFEDTANVKLFPNPVNNTLKIETDFLSEGMIGIVELYDIQGNRLYFKSKKISTNGFFEINDLENLSPGAYIFYFHHPKGNIKKEFLKE